MEELVVPGRPKVEKGDKDLQALAGWLVAATGSRKARSLEGEGTKKCVIKRYIETESRK